MFTQFYFVRNVNFDQITEPRTLSRDRQRPRAVFQKAALALKPDGEPLHQLEVPLNAMDTHGKSVYQVEDLGANFFD
jgi:hypothetical protein